MSVKFSFEDLEVWKKSVEFCKNVIDLTESLKSKRKHYRLIEQLEAASSSVSCNIAEGKGRNSRKEFKQYLYIARGSLFETINLLILFESKGWIESKDLDKMKEDGAEIGKMISGLINSLKT